MNEKFSEKSIAALKYRKADNKADYHWDHNLKGFGIRVYPSGSKSWVVSYRQKGRKRIEILGRSTDLSFAQARELAEKVLQARTQKTVEPVPEYENNWPSIRDLCRFYLEEVSLRKDGFWRGEQFLIDRYILPVWGQYPVSRLAEGGETLLETWIKPDTAEHRQDLRGLIQRVLARRDRFLALHKEPENRKPLQPEPRNQETGRSNSNNNARRRLIDAVEELCARRAYHKVQIADITEQAGLSIGSFYRYFKDKEEIFYEMLDESFNSFMRFSQSMGRDVKDGDALAKYKLIRKRFRFLFTYHLEHPGLFLAWYRHGQGINDRIDRRIELFRNDVIRAMTISFMASTVTSVSHPRILAQSIWGMSCSVLDEMISTGKPDLEVAIRHCTQFMTTGLISFNSPEKSQKLFRSFIQSVEVKQAAARANAGDTPSRPVSSGAVMVPGQPSAPPS